MKGQLCEGEKVASEQKCTLLQWFLGFEDGTKKRGMSDQDKNVVVQSASLNHMGSNFEGPRGS